MPDENEIENETEGTTAEPEAVTAEADAIDEPVAEEAPAAEPAPEEEAAAAVEVEEPALLAAEAEAAPAPATKTKTKKKRLPRSERPSRSKPRREKAAERKPITRLPKPEHVRGRRQERQGTVVSAAADKTIVVRVDVVKAHPTYKKVIKRSTRLHAHDERNEAKPGDIVRIVETRPLSKTKRWRLQEIVEAAK
jgi:small subunit ribosomal protein S17